MLDNSGHPRRQGKSITAHPANQPTHCSGPLRPKRGTSAAAASMFPPCVLGTLFLRAVRCHPCVALPPQARPPQLFPSAGIPLETGAHATMRGGSTLVAPAGGNARSLVGSRERTSGGKGLALAHGGCGSLGSARAPGRAPGTAATELPPPAKAAAVVRAALCTHPQKQHGRAEPQGSEEEGWGAPRAGQKGIWF